MLPYTLERSVLIRALPEVVFGFFTDSERWAAWWGTGSSIDPRPGGRVVIRYPTGTEALGEVLELQPPERIVFTFGYASATPIPPGASRVTISLKPAPQGTRLTLQHDFAESSVRDQHEQGWRYQLALFANAVSDELYRDAESLIDSWFAVWNESDESAREAALRALAAPDLCYQDAFSLTSGVEDLLPHLVAARRFMPGLQLRRIGEVRRCRSTLLVDWEAAGPDARSSRSGTTVFELDADGRIAAVTGFWNTSPQKGENR